MIDNLGSTKRTHKCGVLRGSDEGKVVTVMGFVAKYRNLGSLVFIDVRDISGLVQVAFDDKVDKAVFDKATTLRTEYVVAITGTVRSRGTNINKTLPTGEIEILATELKILSEAETTPFEIKDDVNVNENLRLKYRYLDLRRPSLQKALVLRNKITHIVRNYLADNEFLDIETPCLGKSTPEGARDYLVPSRVHPGEFYALPQSPQIYKQLLMIAGMDRYYQIARCFRDEDLRANRQPEFTQIDMEMSYVESCEDVMGVAEGLVKKVFSECCGCKFDGPFRRITWKEAMERWGSDKPDTRYGLELNNLSDIVKNCGFGVFANAVNNGGAVRAINAKGLASKMTRKDMDAYGEFVKTYGAKGLAWAMVKEDGVTSSFFKFLSEDEKNAIMQKLNAEVGDVLFFVASDKASVTFNSLGALRCEIANKYNLYDKSTYDFLWVTEFPMFEWSEEEQRLVAMHHPFTAPMVEDYPLLDTDPLSVRSNAYDIVINGQEAGGGSVRIHNPKLQEKIFSLIGLTEEQIKVKFGFFVDAFKYGAPPHGGLAFGLDRMTMLCGQIDNIKDVIAFPKVQNASCLMSDAPSEVDQQQLKDLKIKCEE
jgi:aspartyl-tRNA synthetase